MAVQRWERLVNGRTVDVARLDDATEQGRAGIRRLQMLPEQWRLLEVVPTSKEKTLAANLRVLSTTLLDSFTTDGTLVDTATLKRVAVTLRQHAHDLDRQRPPET